MCLTKINNWIGKNKKFLLLLLLLNFIGIIAAFITYFDSYKDFWQNGTWYLLPFVPVSFILYLTMFLFLYFVYKGKKVPGFLLIFTFFVNFVYGMASIIFYPLLMIYVVGFDLYYFWNIFAHGFLGILSFFVLAYLRPVKAWKYLLLFVIIFFKDYLDFFNETFTYFQAYDFGVWKEFLITLILVLQLMAFYLLLKGRRISRD